MGRAALVLQEYFGRYGQEDVAGQALAINVQDTVRRFMRIGAMPVDKHGAASSGSNDRRSQRRIERIVGGQRGECEEFCLMRAG